MKINLILIFIFFALTSEAQPIVGMNGEYVDGAFDPATITTGGTSSLIVTVANGTVAAAIGEVEVYVNFPNSGSYVDVTPGSGPTAGVGSSGFSWVQIPDGGGGSPTWRGTNTVALGDLDGGIFTFSISGVNPTAGDATLTEGYFPDDNASDNPTLIVNAPMPITLSSFTGTSVDCDHVSLQWETASEINNEYMEILRSSDGKEFLSIGKVAGTNAAGGSKYSIEDQNYLLPNGKYYYVLRQVDFDGKMTHHDMIVVKHHCDEVVKSFAIYPNPAVEKISLAVEGFESPQDMSIHILNADGGLVRSMQVNTGLVNEINIDDLPSGVYQIQGLGDSAHLSGRFIKIK